MIYSQIRECQFELDQFYEYVFGKDEPGCDGHMTTEGKAPQSVGDDAEVIRLIRGSKQADKFNALFAGETGGYPSPSEADLALCMILAFWTRKNAEQMDRIFRQSGLYRDKWDQVHGRDTYGTITLGKAIKNTNKVLKLKGTTRDGPEVEDDANKPDKLAFFKCTDMGNGERFAAQNSRRVRYCHPWEKWLTWDGKHWQIDGTGSIHRLAKSVVRSIYQEAERCEDEIIRKAIANWAVKSEKRPAIESMLALAKSEPEIPVQPHELDSDDWAFNTLSGTIDLRTGTLRPHDQADLITRVAPVFCDSNASCPTWNAFLHRIMGGNDALISFLQRAVGYSLTGDTSEQCVFILYGTGANGKSTFLNTIKALLADYAKQAEFSTFVIRKHEGVRNDIADLRGARFVSAIEAESGQRLAESIIKQMTGGDPLKARFLFHEHFEFDPTFKVFLAANHKPIIRGTDLAIWRRIRLIPFTVTIPERERDLGLKDKLKRELPGILNWALEGCELWQSNGLDVPDEIRIATEKYRDEMDIVSDFIADCCLLDCRCSVSKTDLYEAYEKWCIENGEEPLRKKTFGMRITERGLSEERKMNCRKWAGIGLLDNRQKTMTDHDTSRKPANTEQDWV